MPLPGPPSKIKLMKGKDPRDGKRKTKPQSVQSVPAQRRGGMKGGCMERGSRAGNGPARQTHTQTHAKAITLLHTQPGEAEGDWKVGGISELKGKGRTNRNWQTNCLPLPENAIKTNSVRDTSTLSSSHPYAILEPAERSNYSNKKRTMVDIFLCETGRKIDLA